jgi:putative tryptophan/tyrosine transport system substrate-binding protein
MRLSAISQFVKPFGQQLTLIAILLAIAGDTQSPARQMHVIYAGAGTAATDVGFQAYKAALSATAFSGQSPKVSYGPISATDMVQAANQIARLLQSKPDVLVTPTGDSARVAANQPRSSAVVFASFPDPVRLGIVESLGAPGRGVTGVSLADALHAKRLELLIDAFPRVKHVGILLDRWMRDVRDIEDAIKDRPNAVAIRTTIFVADSVQDVDRLMTSPAVKEIDAWYFPPTYVAYVAERELIAHLRRLQVPSIHSTEREVAEGAVMAYAQDHAFVYGAMAEMTARILRGEDASLIPVERPKRFVLAVRPRDDIASLRIRASVTRRADRIY